MSIRKREITPQGDPYQGILVLCHDCRHTSIQAYNEDKTYTCPACGSNMKEVKV